MPETKIIYSGFWDVPHAFVASHENTQYLFRRDFDDDLDDYSPEYDVYILPNLSQEEIEASWGSLEEKGTYIGKIPVKQVAFEPTKKLSIDTVTFDRLPTR
ncbi:MAG TPA: hypothetical protein VFD58_25935 [Blastocatellia bacterium]|nr:hypothetical protein [Blastocatellia bacterium]